MLYPFSFLITIPLKHNIEKNMFEQIHIVLKENPFNTFGQNGPSKFTVFEIRVGREVS